MQELIAVSPTRIGDQVINSVDARGLHEFLEVKTQFKDWIARRIADYDFTEGSDFSSFLSESPKRGRPTREYALSLDMAKELAMVERTDRGKQARQYFIECERRAQADPLAALHDPVQLRALLLENTAERIAQAERLEEIEPLVEAYERIAGTDGSLCITDAAKQLQVRPKDLFSRLQAERWIYRRDGNKHWVGYQDKVQQGLMEHKVSSRMLDDGSERIDTQVRVTPKGLARLAETITAAA